MPRIRAVLFDLDDTLYEELTYVHSGFRAVAAHLAESHGLPAAAFFDELLEILAREGRGRIFDRAVARHDLGGHDLVVTLVNIYREHAPRIALFPDVRPAFTQLRELGMKLGLITDGHWRAQERKVGALGLSEIMDIIIYTGLQDREYWKPSPTSYLDAARKLGLPPVQAAYVGNDPGKDFGGANRAGMLTIHLMRRGNEEGAPCDAAVHAASMEVVVREVAERL